MNKTILRNHVLVWTVFWITDLLFLISMKSWNELPIFPYIFNVVSSTLFFYVCLNTLIIPIFPKSKVLTFFFIFLVILLFASVKFGIEYTIKNKFFVELVFEKKRPWSYINLDLWRFTTMTFYAFAYWYYLKSVLEEKLRRKTEVDFLKAQINPHFLFNTLNFVYNDIEKISPKSGEAIMALTRMMRYSVESTKADLTTLSKELEAVQEYLDLQRLRFGDKLALSYTKTGNFGFMAFPPLVLVSLIENSFKYGVHDDLKNPIVIEVKVTTKGLDFFCKNKKRTDFTDKETTAVGQSNIKRRLDMSYPENYTLNIHETVIHYEVSLNIIWKVT